MLAAALNPGKDPHLALIVYGATTRVSNLFAPHAEPQRQLQTREPLPPRPPYIYAFNATHGIPPLCTQV